MAPAVSAEKNFQGFMRVSPASGAAVAPSPGTNLATSNARAPNLAKRVLVLLTQESGSSDMRQSRFRMEWPRTRPRRNQMRSLKRHAATASASDVASEKLPNPASAPMPSNTGTEGMGNPMPSAKTLATSTHVAAEMGRPRAFDSLL